MKKIAVLTLVVVMLVVTVVPAFAAGGPQSGSGTGICTGNQSGLGSGSMARNGGQQSAFGIRTPFALSGTITGLDSQAKTVSVAVSCGNRLAYPYIGSEVTLLTGQSTRFLLRNDDGTATPITFADLVIGESVSSHGSLVDGVFTASRVTMGALLTCVNQ
jgi:hypothetical protein